VQKYEKICKCAKKVVFLQRETQMYDIVYTGIAGYEHILVSLLAMVWQGYSTYTASPTTACG
jgi:hypothetical protein